MERLENGEMRSLRELQEMMNGLRKFKSTGRRADMKDPIEVDCKTKLSPLHRVKGGSDTVEDLIHSKNKCFKYTSNDGSLSCIVEHVLHTGPDVKLSANEDGTMRQEPKNEFMVYPFSDEDKERLLEIKKRMNIPEDFPIPYETEKEALETVKKLLGLN